MPNISVNENLRTIIYAGATALTNGVGYGIIDAYGRLCIYVDQPLSQGDTTQPIYLQFRGNI